MNKNKGIWLAIAGILLVGIILTLSTNKFVTKQEQTMAAVALETSKAAAVQKERSQETKAKSAAVSSAADLPETAKMEAIQPALESAALQTEAETASQPMAAGAASVQIEAPDEAQAAPAAVPAEETALEETVQSPLKSGNKAAEMVPEADRGDLGVYYKKRLDELGVQVQKMKDSDTEGTTYSMKSNSEKEWKLWDSELNTVYNEILDLLDEEDAVQLVEEERQWIKMRDAAALEASQKYSGGSLEGLEYTSTLASYTRDRVYDLVNTYLVEE